MNEPELSERERELLARGLGEWGGSATATDALAQVMGFENVESLHREGGRIADDLGRGASLSPADLARALVATEIVFASDYYGAGIDWEPVTGFSDAETIGWLREVQRKLIGTVRLPGGMSAADPRLAVPQARFVDLTAQHVAEVSAHCTDQPVYAIALCYEGQGDAEQLYSFGLYIGIAAGHARVSHPVQRWDPLEFELDLTVEYMNVCDTDALAAELGALTRSSLEYAEETLWAVARKLNGMDWTTRLTLTPHFAVYATDLGMDALEAGLQRSLPADAHRELKAAGLLP